MIEVIRPNTLGWLMKKLGDQEMDYLWRCIDNKKGDYKKDLAGNISGSYLLKDRSDWFWSNTLKPLIKRYEKEFGNLAHKVPVNQVHPVHLQSWWVNYQKQGEFNPLHSHTGVYSFVIWMKIPTDWREQKKLPIALTSNSTSISNFTFEFMDILGTPQPFTYQMAPQAEGTLLFFPARLRHIVYPFYNCDDDRISISGNISVNTAKKI